MTIGAYGIEEPTEGKFNKLKDIDLAIIPGVAFDRRGNRKLGICFPYQLLESVPTEDFDIRMNEVIY